jgi:hypothetical protein
VVAAGGSLIAGGAGAVAVSGATAVAVAGCIGKTSGVTLDAGVEEAGSGVDVAPGAAVAIASAVGAVVSAVPPKDSAIFCTKP